MEPATTTGAPETTTAGPGLARLAAQLEFYLSDSSLSKDRRMRHEVLHNDDGYVRLAMFVEFNRIKELKARLEDLVAAVRQSTVLELSPDESRMRRRTPFDATAVVNYDARTIYVEKLPVKSDHESLKTLFGQFGTVTYVFLPRHEASGVVKGFSFVEFETKEAADAALAAIAAAHGPEGDALLASVARNGYTPEQKRARQWRRMRVMSNALHLPPGSAPGSWSRARWTELRQEYIEYHKAQVLETAAWTEFKAAAEVHEVGFMRGAVVLVERLPVTSTAATVKRDALCCCAATTCQTLFRDPSAVQYVDYARGTTSAYVRFKTAEERASAVATLVAAGSAWLDAVPPSREGVLIRTLSLSEDLAYWRRIHSAKATRTAKRQGRPTPSGPALTPPTVEPKKRRAEEAPAPGKAKRVHVHFDDDDNDGDDKDSRDADADAASSAVGDPGQIMDLALDPAAATDSHGGPN